jgi:DNA replication ATP-dependent helicase Dna2
LKLLEGGTEESSGAIKTFGEITQHLELKHQDFFRHWDTLLTKEEKDSMRFRQEIWTMASDDRESAGRCFSGLIIVPGSVVVDQGGQKINKYTYSFEKWMPLPNFNFLESQINEGDPIVVSDEQGHYALAIGYVYRIREAQITVQVDRRLHDARIRQPDFNETYNQAFSGMVDFQTCEQARPPMPSSRTKGALYRVDKDHFSNGMASVRNNLIQLMAPQANKYRRLIVDLEPPFFKDSPAAYELDDSVIQGSLNPDQRRAIEKVMTGV